jgi:hypothetical protein
LGTAHRVSGTIALLLATFVAYHCLWALGLESGTLKDGQRVGTRTVVHGVLGCAVFGAVVVKVTAVRSRRAPGWFCPWLVACCSRCWSPWCLLLRSGTSAQRAGRALVAIDETVDRPGGRNGSDRA